MPTHFTRFKDLNGLIFKVDACERTVSSVLNLKYIRLIVLGTPSFQLHVQIAVSKFGTNGSKVYVHSPMMFVGMTDYLDQMKGEELVSTLVRLMPRTPRLNLAYPRFSILQLSNRHLHCFVHKMDMGIKDQVSLEFFFLANSMLTKMAKFFFLVLPRLLVLHSLGHTCIEDSRQHTSVAFSCMR